MSKNKSCNKPTYTKKIAKQITKGSKQLKHIYYCDIHNGWHVTSQSWIGKKQSNISILLEQEYDLVQSTSNNIKEQS